MQIILKNAGLMLSAFLLTTVLCCCHNFYMTKNANTVTRNEKSNSIQQLKDQKRFFILRSGSDAFYMKNVSVSSDQSTVTAYLDTLPPEHRLHLKNGRKGKSRYKKGTADEAILTEVHLYIPADNNLQAGNFVLPLEKVQKIEVVEKDKGRTTGSYIVGALGYTLGAFAVAAIIIAATKSSCPFVSANTGNEFVLQGEIYGGAIYPQLARDDYMPLRMQPAKNGKLQVKISNELQEKQFTDFADLIVVTHDKNTKVLADEKGNLYSISQPQSPVKAFTSNNIDALPALQQSNDNRLLHFDDTLAENSLNFLVTQFEKPRNAQKGKLVLGIKNSYWLDYLYGEFAKGFGSYYSSFIKKQYKTSVAKLLEWTKDQKLPLEVSLKTGNGWKKIADITTIGPLATREVVVPVDLSEIKGPLLEIRLSSGFMFWEIDYTGMDFTTENNFTVETLVPVTATDEAGRNVLPDLAKKDGRYLAQPVPGNMATIEYESPVLPVNTTRSYILHTKGYYEHVRDFKGRPNIAFLKQFTQPNTFPVFSNTLYKKFRNTNMSMLSKN